MTTVKPGFVIARNVCRLMPVRVLFRSQRASSAIGMFGNMVSRSLVINIGKYFLHFFSLFSDSFLKFLMFSFKYSSFS